MDRRKINDAKRWQAVVMSQVYYFKDITIQKYIFTNNVMSHGSSLIIPVIPIYLL
jgi:hypothetical protein